MAEKNRVWFPAKKYGFGWGLPVTWQGWSILIVYILLVLAGSCFSINSIVSMTGFFFFLMALTSLLIYICWKKGEKPAWRWGDRKQGFPSEGPQKSST